MSAGGTVSPGTSSGILNVSGDATFQTGAALGIELTGTTADMDFSQLDVTGALDLGDATLSATLDAPSTSNEVFTMIQGPQSISGTFQGLAEGSLVTLNGSPFRITYAGGDANNVALARLSANQVFVTQVYEDLLHRVPEDAGLAFWSGILGGGSSRVDVVSEIEDSPEFRADEVEELYATYLHRSADPTGLSAYTSFLANGGMVEQVAAMLAGSDEFYQDQAGGTNDGFLDCLCRPRWAGKWMLPAARHSIRCWRRDSIARPSPPRSWAAPSTSKIWSRVITRPTSTELRGRRG